MLLLRWLWGGNKNGHVCHSDWLRALALREGVWGEGRKSRKGKREGGLRQLLWSSTSRPAQPGTKETEFRVSLVVWFGWRCGEGVGGWVVWWGGGGGGGGGGGVWGGGGIDGG